MTLIHALGLRRPVWFSRITAGALLCLVALFPITASAETIPPAPRAYFNDYTGQISGQTARMLNQRLESFERESSNQLLVAVYDRMDSDSSVQDYTYRVAESWRVGQSGRNNGAVLFVFLGDREMFLQVGYGLEGVIPDATAKRIIEDTIIPFFRSGDINRGLAAGVDAMIAASKGEYTGTGRTVGDGNRHRTNDRALSISEIIFFLIFLVVGAIFRGRGRRRVIYGRGHRHHGGGWRIGGRGGFGGGGGFSGGGGSFGGGGAGGRW
ncbi:MAG: hypothetical protein SynsKO_04620 [Synoicihabitans sp.]